MLHNCATVRYQHLLIKCNFIYSTPSLDNIDGTDLLQIELLTLSVTNIRHVQNKIKNTCTGNVLPCTCTSKKQFTLA